MGLVSFLVIPYSFIPWAMDPVYHLRFFLWSFLTLCLWGFTRCERMPLSLAKQHIFWINGCFLLVGAVSLTGSANLSEGFFSWLNLFLAGAFFWICSQYLYSYPKGVMVLCRWAVIAATGLAVLGLAGRYWDPDVFSGFFFNSIMVNKNLFASSLFLFLPFVIYFFVSGPLKWFSITVLVMPIGITLLLSDSRAVGLALFFSTVPVVLMASCSPFNFFKKKGLIIFALVSFSGLVFFIYPSLKDSETVKLRLNLWNRTAQMILDKPILGVGLGQWRLVFPEYGTPLVINGSGNNVEILAQRPHNDFLWITAETGILGGACYLTFFLMLLYYAFKIIRSRADPGQKIMVLSMVYGISGYLIFSLFSYPKERPLHSLLVMLMASVIVSCYHRLYPVKKVRDMGRRVIVVKSTIVLLLLTSCLMSGFRLYSEIYLKKALVAREKKEWHQVIAHIDSAFLSVYSIDPFGVPLPWYSGMAHYNNKNLSMAVKEFKQALSFHPYHAYSKNNLAVVKELEKENSSIGDSPEK